MKRARRALTLLETVVGALCLAVLMVPTLSFTRTTRELSRLRMVQLEALRELDGLLELLAALPLDTLARPWPPVPGLGDAQASPLDRLLSDPGAPDRRAGIADLVGDLDLVRGASFEPVPDHPGLYRISATISYRSHPGADEPWQSVTGERLIWRKR